MGTHHMAAKTLYSDKYRSLLIDQISWINERVTATELIRRP